MFVELYIEKSSTIFHRYFVEVETKIYAMLGIEHVIVSKLLEIG